jgi:NAD(P)-dependent dehydrogenase (short-subunit alcohol dehydrogenase family)
MVRLEGGITVIAHLHHACMESRDSVRVRALLDRGGRGVLFAFPTDAARAAESDPQVSEMMCTPRHKRVLVTDGTSELGHALIESLLAAGAAAVWSGTPGRANPRPGSSPNVMPLQLDLTDAGSVAAAATRLGGEVEIIINNAEFHGGPASSQASGIALAQAEMNMNYLGPMRLATELAPRLLARAHEKDSRPIAWVNVLSIYALSNLPSHGSFSASKAAALSFSQGLRAQLRPSGIRVLNVFPGPLDEPAFRDVEQPKLRPRALAQAIVETLDSGQEDCYPGEVAQEFLRQWRQDPKVLELELQS